MGYELPILMTFDVWRNSQLSLARFYGQISSNGNTWVLIGQSADLVRQDFVKYYIKFGRDRFLEVLKEHPYSNDKDLLAVFKELTAKKKDEVRPKDMFEQ